MVHPESIHRRALLWMRKPILRPRWFMGMPCTQCARSAKFWMSANTRTLATFWWYNIDPVPLVSYKGKVLP